MRKRKLSQMKRSRYGGKGWLKVVARDYFREVMLVGVVVLVAAELLLVKNLFFIPKDSEYVYESELKRQMIESDGTRLVGEINGVKGVAEESQVLGESVVGGEEVEVTQEVKGSTDTVKGIGEIVLGMVTKMMVYVARLGGF